MGDFVVLMLNRTLEVSASDEQNVIQRSLLEALVAKSHNLPA
jgi:hypothetical protein